MDNRIIRNDDRHRTTALPASSKPQLSYHAGSTNVSGPGRFLCLDARKKWITFGSPLPLYTSPLMTLIIFTTLQKRTSNNPEVPLYTSLRTTILNKIWYKTNLGRTTDYNTIVSNSQAIRYVEYEGFDANIETLEGSGHLEVKTLRMQNTVNWRL